MAEDRSRTTRTVTCRKGRHQPVAMLCAVVAATLMVGACTPSSEETSPAVEAEIAVIQAEGSPIPVLLDSEFRDAVASVDTELCERIDASAGSGLVDTDFARELDDFAGTYPSAHAALLSELVVVGEVLEACLAGETINAATLGEVDAMLTRWDELLR